MRSIAIEAIKTVSSNGNRTYLEHEISGPRLPLDFPQVTFSYVCMYITPRVERSRFVRLMRILNRIARINTSNSKNLIFVIPCFFLQKKSSLAHGQTHYNESLRLRDITLAQMVSQTVWRLSESIVIQWEPKYFNETIHTILESIDTATSQDFKPRIGIFAFYDFWRESVV